MRLNSIKLAGFKSFVDPTQMLFQSNLTAIVGPNGCGKSNIVDAIHCVLGSSSKRLRAEMMANVIFNGTSKRKPVGQASVELIFDNSDSRIAGEYINYPEIAFRRELTSDGQSYYFINGTACRKKDVTDIFLGTGLEYAIIDQGMIAKLVEAKPEELRAYVEEAAGISRYKERRRETENRIKHTRENLERLNDIREEHSKQLIHLQKQANAAERFKVLKAEQRLLRAQLQALLWKDIYEQIVEVENKTRSQEILLEAKHAELTSIQKKIEFNRSARAEQNDNVNEIQNDYYKTGVEINSLEQRVKHSKERLQQLEKDRKELVSTIVELNQQLDEDQQQTDEVIRDIQILESSFADSKQQAIEEQEELKIAEKNMLSWQEQWDEFNENSAQATKEVELEKTRILHLEQKQQTLLQRIARVRDEQAKQCNEELLANILELSAQQADCQQEIELLQERISSLQDDIQIIKIRNQEAGQKLGELNKELRDLQARYASMEALQQIALGKSNTKRNNWLQQNKLSHHTCLAEGLDVEIGWELAIETALASYLDAVCVEEFSCLQEAISSLQEADISFFNTKTTNTVKNANKLTSLSEKVTSNWPVASLLQSIYIADSFGEALACLQFLEPNESIITQDGVWLGHSWLKISRTTHQTTGVIQREHGIKELQHSISQHQTTLAKLETFYQEEQDKLNINMEERELLQHELQLLKSKNSDLLAQIKAKKNYSEQLKQKQISLNQEMRENDQLLEEVEHTLTKAKANLVSISQQAEDIAHCRKERIIERDLLKAKLEQIRQRAITCQQKADENKIRLESKRDQYHFLTQNISRLVRQIDSIKERHDNNIKLLSEINDPLPELTSELQQTLGKRIVIEEELRKSKQHFQEIESKLNELEKQRQQIEQIAQDSRDQLESMRLNCQGLKVRNESHTENIQQAGFSLEIILQEIPGLANPSNWEEKLIKIENRITRLGPINLAAIDEYADLLKRKEYLDNQYNDLIEALDTLENAIRKIDKETRLRFKETYNKLDDLFRALFAQIFDGGEAYLELTSDDLLETGVTVKAQPPGKRNSTIHLLSGGEKALTAIALVFAIFNLNPAPFCVLDEVDAPLDDVNVGRFCNLVKKMSEKVQFIFISHNKISIEMAEQLAGITMHEPGVSRLVSVDINQAISMATS